MYIYIYTHMHIYIHTYIHTYIQTYIQRTANATNRFGQLTKLPSYQPIGTRPSGLLPHSVGKLGQTSLGSTPTSSTLNLFQAIWGGSNQH